jgi:molybdate transport system regulatory protein
MILYFTRLKMDKFKIGSSIWVDKNNKTFLGKGRIELLKLINKTGSLSKAAKEMKMSYKAAWDALNEMNNVSGITLVESCSGGAGGGGSKLTPLAHLYIELYDKIYNEQRDFFDKVEPYMDDYEMLTFFLNRNAIRLSARNQLKSQIYSLKIDDLSVHVKLKIDDIFLTSTITLKSKNELNLKKDMSVYAIIKSSSIKILDDEKCENENCYVATIKNIENVGNIFEYTITIGKNTTLYLSSKNRQKSLNLKDNVKIYINPNDIMIGI